MSIEIYLTCLEEQLLAVSEQSNNFSNLTVSEQQALHNLKNDDSIIIKEADQGSGVVVWDREDYLKEADNHLLDEKFYSECSEDPLIALSKKIGETL